MYKISFILTFFCSQYLFAQENITNTPESSEIKSDVRQKDSLVSKMEKSRTLLISNTAAEPSIKRAYKKSENISENLMIRPVPTQRTDRSEAEFKKQADTIRYKKKSFETKTED